jgi:hypothetical protein
LRRLAQNKEGDGLPEDAGDFEDEARRQEEHASELRRFVERINRSSVGKEVAKSE